MNNFYTYIYLDSRKPGKFVYQDLSFDFEPFYVGKGKGRRFKRIHTEALSRIKDNYKHRKISSIIKNNLNPIILKIVENITEKEAHNKEIELIKIIGRKDKGLGPLVNMTDGGDGSSGSIPSSETLEKRSNTMKEWYKDKANSIKRTQQIQKAFNNKIYQYDYSLNLIKIWPSFHSTVIEHKCSRFSKRRLFIISKNYVWSRKELTENNLNEVSTYIEYLKNYKKDLWNDDYKKKHSDKIKNTFKFNNSMQKSLATRIKNDTLKRSEKTKKKAKTNTTKLWEDLEYRNKVMASRKKAIEEGRWYKTPKKYTDEELRLKRNERRRVKISNMTKESLQEKRRKKREKVKLRKSKKY